MYTIYITEADLLKIEQFPMAALINEAANSNLIRFTDNLANGVGSAYNYSNCSFWDDLDEYDQTNTPKFEGLLVSNEGSEEVVVPFNDVLYYLEILYSRLASDKYDKLCELKQSIEAFRSTYCTISG